MKKNKTSNIEEQYYLASQWQLMWRKLKKHKLAIIGSCILALFYIIVLFTEIISPYNAVLRNSDFIYAPPQRIRFIDQGKFHLQPFVYGLLYEMDKETYARKYTIDKNQVLPISLFSRGTSYKLWGLFPSNIHFFGVKNGVIFLFGTDKMGRDLFSRVMYATRISMSIGLVGVFISFVLGALLGGISGYYGGAIDTIIQRVIEFLISIPTIPLWMGLSAALPPQWGMIQVYFGITIILAILNWGGLARVVRGKMLELRGADFVMAAKIAGAKEFNIIIKHMLPSFLSYLIVNVTLAIPYMILGETSLSFLGLGIRAPAVSWGTLFQDSQNVRSVIMHPWLFIPALFVIIAVLAFNFLGDGLRDAADPYKQ